MTAPVYNILDEYTDQGENADSTSTTPFWVIAVIPLAYPLSYNRKQQGSVTKFPADGAKTRGKTLVITGDCTQLSISGSKDSHLKNLQAVLSQTTHNYLVEIMPGDWVLAWIVNDEEKATGFNGLIERIRNGDACNYWSDGLKFVGRVESMRKSLMRSDNALSVSYQLSARAFSELDTSIFYEQALAEKAKESSLTWMAKVGFDLRKVFKESENGNGQGSIKDNVHVLIPTLLEILLGTGLPSTVNPAGKGSLQTTYGSQASQSDDNPQEAPFSYLVPKEVGDLLGKTSRAPSKAGGILAYADVMELLYGVQSYENTNEGSAAYLKFTPTIAQGAETNAQHKYTGTPMLGAFWPYMPEMTNTPFWNVLEQFLNGTCNEMYTAMRVNDAGRIVPTMVLRQIPFTTDSFINGEKDDSGSYGPSTEAQADAPHIDVTRFLSLPRWKMSPKLLNVMDIGRSNATRVNFVHVYGQNNYGRNWPLPYQVAMNKPIQDELDIQRSGLRAFSTTVACDFSNQAGKAPTTWMKLIADRVMGSHLTMNGTMTSIGISAPICEGDNLEFDGVVYHIESVAHNCSIDTQGGTRSFSTTLTLTNGLRSDDQDGDPNKSAPPTMSNPDLSLYAGIDLSDNLTNNPGVTKESTTEDVKGAAPGDKPFGGSIGDDPRVNDSFFGPLNEDGSSG